MQRPRDKQKAAQIEDERRKRVEAEKRKADEERQKRAKAEEKKADEERQKRIKAEEKKEEEERQKRIEREKKEAEAKEEEKALEQTRSMLREWCRRWMVPESLRTQIEAEPPEVWKSLMLHPAPPLEEHDEAKNCRQVERWLQELTTCRTPSGEPPVEASKANSRSLNKTQTDSKPAARAPWKTTGSSSSGQGATPAPI